MIARFITWPNLILAFFLHLCCNVLPTNSPVLLWVLCIVLHSSPTFMAFISMTEFEYHSTEKDKY